MITRTIESDINQHLFKGKVIVVLGPRQVGKTTLFRSLAEQYDCKKLWLNCDEEDARRMLSTENLTLLRLTVGDNKMLFIDEAQRVPNIGLVLKLLADNIKDLQILVTGSSALDLNNALQEPLTGRKIEYHLYPISSGELVQSYGLLEEQKSLNLRLLYGSYPEVINDPANAQRTLSEITNSYLYKDILMIDNIRKPQLIQKLLVALAWQIGSEVSYNELAQLLSTDTHTIEKYIDLLEKCFIIFRLPAFNRNLRNELKRSRKVYFWDIGIRNAVIQHFAPLELRDDCGKLWENFILVERLKRNAYQFAHGTPYFWRTTTQQELDYIEERDGQFSAIEFKYNAKRKATLPNSFSNTYPVKEFNIITPNNYIEWVL